MEVLRFIEVILQSDSLFIGDASRSKPSNICVLSQYLLSVYMSLELTILLNSLIEFDVAKLYWEN